ncbi:MAG: DUF3631 domain-containing protein [Acidobacteriaceae bacterium]
MAEPTIIEKTEEFLRRYVILPEESYLVIALWIAATHCADLFDTAPYLALLSPVKRCGKTRTLEILAALAHKPWQGVAPSPAALYRMLADGPTLLIDELETLTAGKGVSETQQTLLAVLNAGYKKGATIPRCDGRNHEVKHFPVYGPKAFASTRALPDTLADRCIRVSMQRRLPGQNVTRYLSSRVAPQAKLLNDYIAEAVKAALPQIGNIYRAMDDLAHLEDRDAELFLPLHALCAAIAPHRVDSLTTAGTLLTAEKAEGDEDGSSQLQLLRDMRSVLETHERNVFSAALVERLRSLEDSPWQEWNLTQRSLAHKLRPFDLSAGSVRLSDGRTAKGYRRDDLEAAFSRYLLTVGRSSVTPSQCA